MKKIVSATAFMLLVTASMAQDFGQSGDCQDDKNVYCSWPSAIENAKRAVFTYTAAGGGSCTGTLINQNVSQGNLQQIFVTAQHCIDENVNFNAPWTFYFNYQSPDCDNNSVPNTGDVNGSNRAGTRYRLVSNVTLIDQLGISDFAIISINTPIPPHFNVYYAGWSPLAGQAFNFPHFDVHHPRGDIKKVAKTPVTVAQTAWGCYVVTEIIDTILNWLFGWAVSRDIHTRTVCSYIETPFYGVPFWSQGVVEPGSSGSALLNNDGKIIGTLSGGASSCDFPLFEAFGRFHTSYNKSRPTRDALNPSAGWLPTSLGGRQIEEYATLENLSGQYFPAGDYQPNNQVKLKAEGVITTLQGTNSLVIRNGADFIFESATSIILRPGFVAQAGSTFKAHIVPSNARKQEFDPLQKQKDMMLAVAAIDVPAEKAFEPTKYLADFKGELGLANYAKVYPNPTKDIINLDLTFSLIQSVVKIKVLSPVGQEVRSVWKEDFQSGTVRLDLGGFPNGMYFVQVQGDTHTFTKGVVLEK